MNVCFWRRIVNRTVIAFNQLKHAKNERFHVKHMGKTVVKGNSYKLNVKKSIVTVNSRKYKISNVNLNASIFQII